MLVPAVSADVDQVSAFLLFLLLFFFILVRFVESWSGRAAKVVSAGPYEVVVHPADALGRVRLEVPLVPEDERPVLHVDVFPLSLRPLGQGARAAVFASRRRWRRPNHLRGPRPGGPGVKRQGLVAVGGGAQIRRAG